MIEQTNLASELCPLMGVAASPAWGQVPSNKHPLKKKKKAQYLLSNWRRRSRWGAGYWLAMTMHKKTKLDREGAEGWKRRGNLLKEVEKGGDEVVVSGDGWVGGLFCHI